MKGGVFLSLNWTNIEAIIFDVFELYRRSNRQITLEFPDSPDLQEILRDKTESIAPDAFDQIQAHLNENFSDILIKWIEREFDYSTGALALSFEEFSEFFQLDKDVTITIINKTLATTKFVLLKETDQEVGRIQLDSRFSRNYWVKSELVPREAESLLEIGALLNNPLISGLKRTSIKNRHLIRLDLRSLKLGWIPECIGDFPYLEELNLQNNLLVSLPKTIGKLKNLKQLWAPSNKFESLPDTIGDLKSLKRLSIANNQISSLPKRLTELKNLVYLDVRETLIEDFTDLAKTFPNVRFPDVSSIPKGTIREFPSFIPLGSNLSMQRSFLTDEDLFQIFKPQYYQIFVLGNKGAGKTSLLNRKLKDTFNDDSIVENGKSVEKHIIKDSILFSAVDSVLLTANIEKIPKESQRSRKF